LRQSIVEFKPEIVFHLAAQPLVRYSYQNPIETYQTNVMGTVHLLEVIREVQSVRALVNVTTDKCYENKEWLWGYRENEPLGGYDPYSNSKACSELVTSAYRQSYFNANDYPEHGCAIASARAGNVIGGGDWSEDRLIPDLIHSFSESMPVVIRSPDAIRPWQHVLDPLAGYISLAQRLYSQGCEYAVAWNFGPKDHDTKTVLWIVKKMMALWGEGASWQRDGSNQPHEAHYLKLDCSKAGGRLGWQPQLSLTDGLERVISWHKAFVGGKAMRDFSLIQIKEYMDTHAKLDSQ